MKSNLHSATLSLLLALGSSGCGDDLRLEDYQCTKDPELLETPISCSRTAQCPCGSRCEFGQCMSACTRNDQCNSGVCDVFGQCAQADVQVTIPPAPTPEESNFLRVAPSSIDFAPGVDEDSFVVQMGNAATELELRITSRSPRYAIACGGESFSNGCSILLDQDSPTNTVRVQRLALYEGATGEPEIPVPAVYVATPTQTRVVVLNDVESDVGSGPRLGTYRGFATIQSLELDGASTDWNDDAGLTFPITVYLGEDALAGEVGLVAIDDPFQLFGARRTEDSFFATAPGGATLAEGDVFGGRRDHLILDDDGGPAGARPYAIAATQTLRLRQNGSRRTDIELDIVETIDIVPDRAPLQVTFKATAQWEVPDLPRLVAEDSDLESSGSVTDTDWPGDRFDGETFNRSTFDALLASPSAFTRAQNLACSDGTNASLFDDALLEVEIDSLETQERIRVPTFDGDLGCQDQDGSGVAIGDPKRMPIFLLYGPRDDTDIQLGLDPEEYDGLLIACLAESSLVGTRKKRMCIDMARWYAATQTALDANPTVEADGTNAHQLGSYLVSRYLDVNGFLADTFELQRAVRRYFTLQGSDALPLETAVGFPTAREFVAGTAERWDAILHPALLRGILAIDSATLNAPDYRPVVLGQPITTDAANDIHSLPVFVAMLNDVVSQGRGWQELSRELYYGRTQPELVEESKEIVRDAARRGLLLSLASFAMAARVRRDLAAESLNNWQVEFAQLSGKAVRLFDDLAEELSKTWEPPETLPLPYNQVGDQSTTGSRFRAMSEFLLGDGTSIGGVIGAELAEARRIYDRARNFYRSYRREAIQFERLTDSAEDRLDYLYQGVGARIVDLCGFKSDGVTGFQVFAEKPDPYTCFIDEVCAEAAYRPPDPATAMYRSCRAGAVLERAGDGVDEILETIADEVDADAIAACLRQAFPAVDGAFPSDRAIYDDLRGASPALQVAVDPTSTRNDTRATLNRAGVGACSVVLEDLELVEARLITAGLPPAVPVDAERICRRAYERFTSTGIPAECRTEVQVDDDSGDRFFDDTPSASCSFPVSQPASFDEAPSSCFVGKLGVKYAKILRAQAAIEQAQTEVEYVFNKLDVESDACQIVADSSARLKGLYNDYVAELSDLRDTVAISRNVAAGGKALQSCGKAVSKVDGIATGIAAGVSCAASAAVAGLDIAITQKSKQISKLGDDLKRDLANIEANAKVELCYNRLNLVVAELGPATANLAAAGAQYDTALTDFQQAQSLVTQYFNEGTEWESSLNRRRVQIVPQDYRFREYLVDLNFFVERVQDRLLEARRAVEWELQQSLVDPARIRTEYDIEELAILANELRNAVLSGRVAGGNPTSGIFTLSVRDAVLNIVAPEDQIAGFHRMTVLEQMRNEINSPRFSVYDDEGQWVGQSIPFSLSPEGLGRGEGVVSNVLSSRLCGEKVWSVGAVAVGRDLAELDGTRLFRVFLKKRNHFYSRACTPDAEPIVGYISNDAEQSGVTVAESSRYTAAWVNARVFRSDSVSAARAAIEKGDLTPTLTTELAGFGLYGDYELFFPASTLNVETFDIGALQDIILLFDLVAVTNNARF